MSSCCGALLRLHEPTTLRRLENPMIFHILNGTFGNGNTGIRDYVFTFYVLEERREPIVYGSNIHSLGCDTV